MRRSRDRLIFTIGILYQKRRSLYWAKTLVASKDNALRGRLYFQYKKGVTITVLKRLHALINFAIHVLWKTYHCQNKYTSLGLNCTHPGTSCQSRTHVQWDNVGADHQIQVVSWYSKYHGRYILKCSDQVKIFLCNEVCHLATLASIALLRFHLATHFTSFGNQVAIDPRSKSTGTRSSSEL